MTGPMELMVSAIRINGEDNVEIELMDPSGAELPSFAPGAHVDVRTPGGALRQYSLCGPSERRDRYHICVRRDPASRGGSKSLHEDLRVRATLQVSVPRNLFSLPRAGRYLLFSAGIGITPIISMARHLQQNGHYFEFHHFENTARRIAFHDELTTGVLSPATRLYLAEEGRDLTSVTPQCLEVPAGGTIVMACGPGGFLDLLQEKLSHYGWRADQFHSERFQSDAKVPADAVDASSFEVRLASSGRSFTVGPAQTVASVLLANGIGIELSCEQGMCGACLTQVIEGEPDHRDTVLSPAEKSAGNQMTICCSRAKSKVLVLDL